MSIRFKLTLLVLFAFVVNILLVYGYYNLFLSTEISNYNASVQEQLQAETDNISREITERADFAEILYSLSKEKGLIIQLSDENGTVVLHTGEDRGISVESGAASLVHLDDGVYLLKVVRPMPLKHIAAYRIGWDIFIAEIAIICLILLLAAVPIYLDYVKPIVALQRNMEKYKEGIQPKSVLRKDEIGLLQNRFVTLTDAIEMEKQKQHLIIASISHDIKTPLTSIMGFAERLKKPSLPSDKRDNYVNIIYDKAVSINNLVEEFDEYLNLHIQNGIKQQRISVEKFCAILKSDYEAELAERGVAFTVTVTCPNKMIFVDVSKLRRVFGNIISNSLKHFNRREASINVFCTDEEDSIVFSVEDNGKGISDEDLSKIFDPFYTSDKGRSVAGLGLSICKDIIEACGGTIIAENDKRGGTTIKIRLPS